MNVGQLREKLEKFANDVDIILDADENGWYNIEAVETFSRDEEGLEQIVNLVSSSEA